MCDVTISRLFTRQHCVFDQVLGGRYAVLGRLDRCRQNAQQKLRQHVGAGGQHEEKRESSLGSFICRLSVWVICSPRCCGISMLPIRVYMCILRVRIRVWMIAFLDQGEN